MITLVIYSQGSSIWALLWYIQTLLGF